jgi:hypothetical protein
MGKTLEGMLLEDARELGAGPRWPARWFYPTENSIPANPSGSVLAPAAAAKAVMVSFTVPRGFRFILEKYWHFYQGTTAFVEGSGALVFSLIQDANRAVADMDQMLTTRGSPAAGPWPLRSFLRFEEGTLLTYQVLNASQAVDASSFVSAGLCGRLEPLDCGLGVGMGSTCSGGACAHGGKRG